MSLDISDDKSTLVQLMAWCHQAPSHYLNQCWPRPMSPYGVTRPQWVNFAISDEENEIRERHRNSRRHQQTAAKPEDNPGKQRLKDHVRPVQNKKAPQRPAQKVQQKQAASERRKRKKVQYQERNSSDSDCKWNSTLWSGHLGLFSVSCSE